MKILFLFMIIAGASAKLAMLAPRVTGGFDARTAFVKSFVALEIEFESSIKHCGGFLGSPANRVFTAASCVFDSMEGKANTIRFGFGQSNDFSLSRAEVDEIYKVKSYNPNNPVSSSNLAAIMISETIPTSSVVAPAVVSTQNKPDAFVGEKLFACGFGVINNSRNKTKTLKCTTLRVVPTVQCFQALQSSVHFNVIIDSADEDLEEDDNIEPADEDDNDDDDDNDDNDDDDNDNDDDENDEDADGTNLTATICTKNFDDRNVCGGDIGGPVFSNKTGTLTAVGVISSYPDSRFNSHCQDGHHVMITQLGVYASFIKDPSATQERK